MTVSHLKLMFWLVFFLALGEAALEIRATRRGFETLLFGAPPPAESAAPGAFGPTEEFPFRSPLFQPDASGLRIWIASSSYAEDVRYPPELLFPNQVGQQLSTLLDSPVHALNRSRAGFTIETNAAQLREGRHWAPDVALLYQLTNDLNALSSLPGLDQATVARPADGGLDRIASVLDRLYEATTLFAQLRGNVTPLLNEQRLLPDRLPDGMDLVFRRRVEKFVDTAEEIGATPVLATLGHQVGTDDFLSSETRRGTLRWAPEISTEGYLATIESWNEVIRAVASQRGLALIDTEAALRHRPDLFRDLTHFTPEGHRYVARHMAETLLRILVAGR